MTNRRLEIPDYVKKVMIRIYDFKFNVYVVGDCMRNFARNRKAGTYTLVTNARLKDIVDLFNEHYPTNAHKNEFRIKSDGKIVIVKVFDKETFSIDDYLSKRDFTFNAIAYTFDNYILDNYCGIQDIRKGCVKAVRNDAFANSPSTIVAGMKFACVFRNGYVEHLTYNKMKENLYLLDDFNSYEYKDDFLRMIYTKNAPNIFRKYPKIMTKIIPYSNKMIQYDDMGTSLYERMILNLENLKYNSKRPTLAGIYLLSGKIETEPGGNYLKKSEVICEKILKEFKIKTKLVREVVSIIKYFDTDLINESNLRKITGIIGVDIIKEIYALRESVAKAYNKDSKSISNERSICLEKIKSMDIFYINDLAVDGLYLHNLGFEGEDVGDKLIEVYLEVFNKNLKNNEQDIRNYLSKYRNT